MKNAFKEKLETLTYASPPTSLKELGVGEEEGRCGGRGGVGRARKKEGTWEICSWVGLV